MSPNEFRQANKIVRKPQEMSREQVPNSPLPTYFDGKGYVSCWRPDLLERLSVLLFGKIWVRLRTLAHPPTEVWAVRNPFEEIKDTN